MPGVLKTNRKGLSFDVDSDTHTAAVELLVHTINSNPELARRRSEVLGATQSVPAAINTGVCSNQTQNTESNVAMDVEVTNEDCPEGETDPVSVQSNPCKVTTVSTLPINTCNGSNLIRIRSPSYRSQHIVLHTCIQKQTKAGTCTHDQQRDRFDFFARHRGRVK